MTRPRAVRRQIASSSPAGRCRYARLGPPEAIDPVGGCPEPRRLPGRLLRAITRKPTSGEGDPGRLTARTEDRDEATNWQTRQAQYDAVCSWGIPDHARLQRVSAIDVPVFVANGDSDPMVLPHYSYLLAGLIPQSRVKIYPDAGHGFLFQHHAEFARDVDAFLSTSE